MWNTVLMLEPNVPTNLAFAADIVVKVSVVVCAAALMCRLLRRSSAANRYYVWTIAMLSSLLVPFSALVLPAWQPGSLLPNPPVAYTASKIEPVASPAVMPSTIGGTTAVLDPQTPMPSTSPVLARLTASGSFFAIVWAVITLLLLVRSGCAIVGLRRLYSRSSEVADSCWIRALREATKRLGMSRHVSLRHSDTLELPVASGTLRPFVMLPKFFSDWSVAKRRSVLLHELAHIKRRDIETLWIANLTTALLWFHPLVWYVRRRMRIERECACDDMVLEAGIRPSQYSSVLVEFAEGHPRTSNHPFALSMASERQLPGRIKRILDVRACRRPMSLSLAFTTSFLILAASIALATAERVNAQTTAISDPERPNIATMPADAVVGIQITRTENESTPAVEFSSGVVVHQPGYVLTQLSSVDKGRKFQLLLRGGRRVNAELVLCDKQTNVAVLRALEKISQPSVVYDVGNQPHVGDRVKAIGAGVDGTPTATDGAIQSLGRTISVAGELEFSGLIQVAAQPIAGQSGGPLVNHDGKMVGLNVSVRTGNLNQMFAIPVKQLVPILRLLPDETDPLGASTDDEVIERKPVFYAGGRLPKQEFRLPANYDLDLLGAIEMIRGSTDLDRCDRAIIVRPRSNGNRSVNIEVDLAEARRKPRRRPLIQAGDTIVFPEEDTTLRDNSINQRYRRIPIRGPITAGGVATAIAMPTNEEIFAAFAEAYPDKKLAMDEATLRKVRIVKEKIADYIDPPRHYPLVGPAMMHHAHYKCTVKFDGGKQVDWPADTLDGKSADPVIYIDHKHLHCVGSSK